MKTTTSLTVLAMLVALTGCEPTSSLHPLFGPGDRVFEPALVGDWVSEADTDRSAEEIQLTLRAVRENAYELIFVDENKKSYRLRAQSARLGNFLFLDVSPDDRDADGVLQIPAHAFFKVQLEPETLELAYLDDEWLKERVLQKKVQIAHELLGSDIVLTASTKDLQALVLKFATDPAAFRPVRFRRHTYPRGDHPESGR